MLQLALALALSTPVGTFALPGQLHDVFELPSSELIATFSDSRGRALRSLTPSGLGTRRAVPSDALLVDGCSKDVVFAKPSGLFNEKGDKLIDARAVFPVADPASLFVYPLCSKHVPNEYWLPTARGIEVSGPKGRVLLKSKQKPRSYAGSDHRGLRAQRSYGAALSLYAPLLYEADLNGDGEVDLLTVHDSKAALFLRKGGALATRALYADLNALTKAKGREVRVHQRGKSLWVSLTLGTIPKKTTLVELRASESALKVVNAINVSGFLAPLQDGDWTFHVDTSVLAMGKVLMTQTLPLTLRNAAQNDVLSLSIDADLSRSRINGSFPRAGFDVDKDGINDLIDLGRNERVRVFRGRGSGFEKSAYIEEKVSSFSRVWAFKKGLVLVGKKLTLFSLSKSEIKPSTPRRR